MVFSCIPIFPVRLGAHLACMYALMQQSYSYEAGSRLTLWPLNHSLYLSCIFSLARVHYLVLLLCIDVRLLRPTRCSVPAQDVARQLTPIASFKPFSSSISAP
jgi:hypothetical protein